MLDVQVILIMKYEIF